LSYWNIIADLFFSLRKKECVLMPYFVADSGINLQETSHSEKAIGDTVLFRQISINQLKNIME
jgi:hypothetical protein